MTIRGYRLPKGTPIIFAPITLHRSPDNWLRPNEFLPERFSPQQLEEKVDPSEACTPRGGLLGLRLHVSPAADCPASPAFGMMHAHQPLKKLLSCFPVCHPQAMALAGPNFVLGL